MRSARYHWAWLTITLTVVAAGFGAATTEAQVVVIGQMRFGDGAVMGFPRSARPVDEGSGLIAGDDFRRIGDPWWDDVARDDGGDALPAVKQRPAEPVPVPPVALNPDGSEKLLDAATLSREQRESLFTESARLAAITGMMSLRRELTAVRHVRPALDEQQRSFVLAAGRKALRERLSALAEKPLTRWTKEQKRSLEDTIREALAASLAANESDAARDAYVAEVARRDERRKRAAVDVVVAEIDRDARLSIAERTRLTDGLVESYRESWRGLTEAFAGDQAFAVGMPLPNGLDRSVERLLGKQRAGEWQARRQTALQEVGMQVGHAQMHQIRAGGRAILVRPNGPALPQADVEVDVEAEAN
jgi:hypothetical protein